MKIVIFVMMVFAQSALCAELLMPNHLFYTSEQSDEFAFESSDKNDILQNPHPKQSAHLLRAKLCHLGLAQGKGKFSSSTRQVASEFIKK